MFRSYLIAIWRNLKNNKLYSFISIGGLAVGISVCMLIMVYVAHEMSFDKFHKNAEKLFTVARKITIDEKELTMERMSYESAPLIKSAGPMVQNFLRMTEMGDNAVIENVASTDKKFLEKKMLLADSNFFNFFSFSLVQGDPKHVLDRPFTMVISERAAKKYFGNDNPVGKVLKYNGQHSFEITGIAANPPSNSTIDYDFIGSVSSVFSINDLKPDPPTGKPQAGNFKTFLQVRSKSDVLATENLVQKLSGEPDKFKYILLSFANQHMTRGDRSTIKYMKIFSGVALLILLLALVNYMSLATARSSTRSKEIGVRKVMGADRKKIIKQFYTESAIYAVAAFLLGLLFFSVLKPAFYNILQLDIDDSFLYSPLVMGIYGVLLITTILIAGSYPSLVLSSFNPVKVLYGHSARQHGGISVRKFFTVLQFTASIALIISSIIIDKQLYFFRHTDTGVNKEHVVMIPYEEEVSKHSLAFKKEIEKIRGVNNTAIAATSMYYGGNDMNIAQPVNSKENFVIPVMWVDNAFIDLLGLHWKIPPANKEILVQEKQVVLNEEAISKFNLPPGEPVGKQISIGDTVRICGILQNFNYRSLHEKIEPLCMYVKSEADSIWQYDGSGCLFVRVDPQINLSSLLQSVKKAYDGFSAKKPFEFQFMDDAFNAQFKAEDRLSKIFSALTVLTILIACLGLFGLATFSAVQRRKEIGIRKVLGAGVMNIISMISGSFVRLVFLSIILASPIAWFFMNKWLQDFAYRVNIGWWVFVLAGILALLITVITVSFQAIKAAVANPVKSLRTE